ncbi:conserved membrane hypothetical protein [Stenotrophomonas thermophila]|nr:conserved membrane hypothetical protein [Stenotrophomonas maltophilia]
MESSQRAWTHLQVVLSIFPRVDAMLAVLLGVNTAMSGVLFSKWPEAAHASSALVILTTAFSLFSGLSYLAIYRAAFPNVDPAGKSTIFFGHVAKLTSAEYARLLLDVSDRDLAVEIAHQVWRNASILTAKYKHLRRAFGWLLASIVPWVVSLLSISIAA